MGEHSNSETGATTLAFLCNDSQQTDANWKNFVDRYGPKIYAWCHKQGLQHADIEDVTLRVLEKLFLSMQSPARYDPVKGRFRPWLRKVVVNAIADCMKRSPAARIKPFGPNDLLAADDDFVRDIVEREIFAEAAARTQEHFAVSPKKWEAFRLRFIDGRSSQETARRLGFANIGTVYNHVSEVRKVFDVLLKQLSTDDD